MIHLIKTANATTTIHITPAHPKQAIHYIYQQFSTHKHKEENSTDQPINPSFNIIG